LLPPDCEEEVEVESPPESLDPVFDPEVVVDFSVDLEPDSLPDFDPDSRPEFDEAAVRDERESVL
jgi:hypothetical protein